MFWNALEDTATISIVFPKPFVIVTKLVIIIVGPDGNLFCQLVQFTNACILANLQIGKVGFIIRDEILLILVIDSDMVKYLLQLILLPFPSDLLLFA